jgi:hypothetical protein
VRRPRQTAICPAPGLPGARGLRLMAARRRSVPWRRSRRTVRLSPATALHVPWEGWSRHERAKYPRPLLRTCLGKGWPRCAQAKYRRLRFRRTRGKVDRAPPAGTRRQPAGARRRPAGARRSRQERAVSPRGAELLHDAQGSSGNGTRVVQPRPGTLARTYSPRFVDESLGGRPVFTILPNPDSRRLTGVCRLAQPPASAIPSVPVTRRWIR